MSNIVREYKESDQEKLNISMQCLKGSIDTLYTDYKRWRNKYAGLIDKVEQYLPISEYYESLCEILDKSKSEMKKVYSCALFAESKLSRKLDYNAGRVELQKIRIQGLRDLICNRKLCFNDVNFLENLRNVSLASVYTEYIKALETYLIDNKWKELLNKDADLLSDDEYMALAMIYTTLDESESEEFINLLFNQTRVYKETIWNEIADAFIHESNKSCTYWEIDKEKVEKLNESMSTLISYNYNNLILAYKTKDDNFDQILENRTDMLQKSGALQAISQIGEISGKADSAGINLTYNDKESIILKYTEYGNIGSIYSPTFSNMCERTITISRPNTGVANSIKAVGELEKDYSVKYGISANINTVVDPVTGTIIDKGIEKVFKEGSDYLAEKFTDKVASKLIGVVPILGDGISLAIDIAGESNDLNEDRKFAEATIKELKSANYDTMFNLSVVYVDYSDAEQKSVVLLEPTAETLEIIERYNNKISDTNYHKIDINDVLYNSKELCDICTNMYNNDIDLYNDIFGSRY